VSRVSDADEIRHLLYRYAECIDAADFAGVGALFERGAIGAPGMAEPARGAEAVRRLYESANQVHQGSLKTLHLVANPIVEVAADRASATCRSRYVVLQATPKLPLQPIIAGRYFDRFARDAAGWNFVERRIEIDLVGDLSEHLRFDLARATGARS
jgi:3-phenylpropionate/cinnamic acid dioxygenase small subunit